MELATLLDQELSAFSVRELTTDDGDLIFQLQKQHPDYFDNFLNHSVTKKEALMDLTDLPRDAMADQKTYLGIFQGHTLVATIDIIIDYPLPQMVWIGRFMTDPKFPQSARLDIYQTLERILKATGAQVVQLAVYIGETSEEAFWRALDFTEKKRTTFMRGDMSGNVIILQKSLV
ncbi:acetyltransferase [Levilactobacillus bambusae]|uniref:Acetyltransferase n=1 Tax=Levilactobacillus bambusae TaxID=2024736 RepID=A0A2V1MZ63_9LACO|nr:acetyltransferase [Levilactobacillus bambusae]PWF99435.1 acetyltransferase [Levilactobacillus bambusae]